MSWLRIKVHVVFSTKNREPLLNEGIRKSVFNHMKENAVKKGVWLDSVNGHIDHAHCLISLGKDQSIGSVVQLLKGESSYWINKEGLTKDKFAWQNDYWAVGLSESHLLNVQSYIRNQEEHHKKISFNAEVDEFIKKYGWVYVE